MLPEAKIAVALLGKILCKSQILLPTPHFYGKLSQITGSI